MIEALAIRILHVFHALRPKRTPGLCPPACSEGHTYAWPCRARIRGEASAEGIRYHRGGADMLVDPPSAAIEAPPFPINMAPVRPDPTLILPGTHGGAARPREH